LVSEDGTIDKLSQGQPQETCFSVMLAGAAACLAMVCVRKLELVATTMAVSFEKRWMSHLCCDEGQMESVLGGTLKFLWLCTCT
jgi:hypothetical protein